MSLEKARDLVLRSIKSAISRDTMSGDGIDLMTITKQGITEEAIKF
jgi:proteasome beta subunit